MDALIEVCVNHMANENFTAEQAKTYRKELLPTLNYWRHYEQLSDNGQFETFKWHLIDEINAPILGLGRSFSPVGYKLPVKNMF